MSRNNLIHTSQNAYDYSMNKSTCLGVNGGEVECGLGAWGCIGSEINICYGVQAMGMSSI